MRSGLREGKNRHGEDGRRADRRKRLDVDAIDADSKLIPCWLIGKRDGGRATEFMQDLAGRLANRVQLTSGGLKVYLNAVADSFGEDIDYAVLHKIYGADRPDAARYSPAVCVGCDKKPMIGNPDEKHVSTSYVERANLSMRMSMRRFTRLTNAFSKKLENHAASVAIVMTWYNFGRVHQTLKMTPAMKAGVSQRAWTVDEMVGLLVAVEPKSTRPRESQTDQLPRFAILVHPCPSVAHFELRCSRRVRKDPASPSRRAP
jgi:hypothetical protein